jgi:hypothetical protein
MNRFDDLFDADQPADELEDALMEMFARRSADITEPAALRAGTDAPVPLIPRLASRAADVPGGLPGTLLAAAVVALLVLGSVLAVNGLSHRHNPAANQPTPSGPTVSSPAPTASPTAKSASCPLPASWLAAINASTVPVDQPQNRPVSAGPDGTFLMLQTSFTHDELAIFDRSGHGSTIWQAADPVHDFVDVSPDSATSAAWVVFGLTRSQNLADHGVVAWNRASGQSTTIRLLSASEEAANTVIDVAPIVADNTAYWIEHRFGQHTNQTLVAQQLPNGLRSTSQVSQVSRLAAIGGGVALLKDPTDPVPGHTLGSTQTLTAGPGLTLPASLRNVAGVWFTSDGSTLSWLNGPVESALLSWRPGLPGAQSKPVHGAELRAEPAGPLLIGSLGNTLLDTRDGSIFRQPAGIGFSLATGGDLIVTSGGGVHRVALSALPPTRC